MAFFFLLVTPAKPFVDLSVSVVELLAVAGTFSRNTGPFHLSFLILCKIFLSYSVDIIIVALHLSVNSCLPWISTVLVFFEDL